MFREVTRNNSRFNRPRLLAGILATALSVPALAQSVQFPTYKPGPQTNGSFVVSDGTVIKPAGTQVNLGIRVRAKAITLNPTDNHTAAVLVMGTSGSNGKAVEEFNTQTGAVLQTYEPAGGTNPDGSTTGITYSPDGKYLLFSQDGNYGPTGFVTIANVNPTTGLLSDNAQVNVPLDATIVSVAGIKSRSGCNDPLPGLRGEVFLFTA